jgi:hypothetical protein
MSCDKLLELGQEAWRRDPAFLDAEIAKGSGRDTGRDVLHLGHDRRGQGVVLTHASLIDRAARAAEMEGLSDDRRGARLPAAGLDRPEHLFLRAALRHRLLHLLPGIGRDGDERHARHRADLLLCAAARVRGAAHAGFDPHGGRERAKASAVPALHGGRGARSAAISSMAGPWARSTACFIAWATCSSSGRCATCWA